MGLLKIVIGDQYTIEKLKFSIRLIIKVELFLYFIHIA